MAKKFSWDELVRLSGPELVELAKAEGIEFCPCLDRQQVIDGLLAVEVPEEEVEDDD